MNNLKKVFFNWGISDHYGWGIYGFNLLVQGLKSNSFQILPLQNPSFLFPLDPISSYLISNKLPKLDEEFQLKSDDIFLTALGNSNQPFNKKKCRDIGVIFSETNPLIENEIENLKKFEFVVAGSKWNAKVLEESGINAKVVIQGIDLDRFQLASKRYFKDKFVVFSGGKLEYRKGQDILLKAFSRFAARHNDAILLAAWRSPWEMQIAASINQSGLCKPFINGDDMNSALKTWATQNEVCLDQVIFLEATPNKLMPEVFREVDLAVFPNRCEGGTNLVAMEALASGVPSLISRNTGHLDIIKDGNCFPLDEQKTIKFKGCKDWGESSVEEVDCLMEEVYQGRLKIDRLIARESMLEFSWENAINNLISLF